MSHIYELGLGTSLYSHETNSFVVQPYEPIPLIVLPYRLLICSKSSKPYRLGPGTHAITILRTHRPIVADGNSTSSMPIMRSTIQAHPRPLLDLVRQAQTPQPHAYTSYT